MPVLTVAPDRAEKRPLGRQRVVDPLPERGSLVSGQFVSLSVDPQDDRVAVRRYRRLIALGELDQERRDSAYAPVAIRGLKP